MAHMPLSRPVQGCVVSVAPQARLTTLQRLFAVWRQRQHLGRLPEHLRRDLGLCDREIAREVARPIWDVPATWRL